MMHEKSAFRTIGGLSRELNIKPHILRYWEDQFAMLQPLKRAGARRHYRPEDVEMVQTINRLLNEEGYTIKGARKFLTSRKNRPAAPVADVPGETGAAIPMATNSDAEASPIPAEPEPVRNRMLDALNKT